MGFEKGGGVGNTAFVVIPVAEGIGAHERDFKSQEKGRSQTSTVGDWFDRQAITNMLAKTFGMISEENEIDRCLRNPYDLTKSFYSNLGTSCPMSGFQSKGVQKFGAIF